MTQTKLLAKRTDPLKENIFRYDVIMLYET